MGNNWWCYNRHGNGNAAMVTVQLRIVMTTALTSGTEYVILGFPSAPTSIACTTTKPSKTEYCYIHKDGTLRCKFNTNFSVKDPIEFNCTYLTT